MLAIDLDTAKNIAFVVAVVFVVGAIVSLWLMKTIAQKAAVVVVLGLLAFAVWSQRTSLQDCADRVKENIQLRAGSAAADPSAALDTELDTTCSFFGVDVDVPAPRA